MCVRAVQRGQEDPSSVGVLHPCSRYMDDATKTGILWRPVLMMVALINRVMAVADVQYEERLKKRCMKEASHPSFPCGLMCNL